MGTRKRKDKFKKETEWVASGKTKEREKANVWKRE
jgi:hypothetical protein